MYKNIFFGVVKIFTTSLKCFPYKNPDKKIRLCTEVITFIFLPSITVFNCHNKHFIPTHHNIIINYQRNLRFKYD